MDCTCQVRNSIDVTAPAAKSFFAVFLSTTACTRHSIGELKSPTFGDGAVATWLSLFGPVSGIVRLERRMAAPMPPVPGKWPKCALCTPPSLLSHGYDPSSSTLSGPRPSRPAPDPSAHGLAYSQHLAGQATAEHSLGVVCSALTRMYLFFY